MSICDLSSLTVTGRKGNDFIPVLVAVIQSYNYRNDQKIQYGIRVDSIEFLPVIFPSC